METPGQFSAEINNHHLALLKAATSEAVHPQMQLRRIIRGWLDTSAADEAIVSDLDLLEEPAQTVIRTQLKEIESCIASVLREGNQEGAFRPFDPDLIAQILVGTLNWGILWYGWISPTPRARADNLQRAAKVVETTLLNGLSRKEAPAPALPEELRSELHVLLEASEANAWPDPTRVRLIEEASRQFSRRGVDSVSVEDVADAVGATKGAVYHHFLDKAHLLKECYDRAFNIYEGIIGSVMAERLNGFNSLLAVFRLNTEAQLHHKPPMILLQPGLEVLPTDYRIRAKRMSANMLSLYQRGCEDGSLTEVDPLVVEALAGAFFWIQRWQSDKPESATGSIIGQMVDLFAHGLAAPK